MVAGVFFMIRRHGCTLQCVAYFSSAQYLTYKHRVLQCLWSIFYLPFRTADSYGSMKTTVKKLPHKAVSVISAYLQSSWVLPNKNDERSYFTFLVGNFCDDHVMLIERYLYGIMLVAETLRT